MSKRDYYDILGITPEASERELKKAYRSMARKYHPDLNRDEGAEVMFKFVAEAYEVLADEERRAIYDRTGHQGLEHHKRGGGVGAGFESVDDIFAQFNDLFGDVFSFNHPNNPDNTPAPQKGKDLRHTLELSFEEAIFGTKRRFHITRQHVCDACDGEGMEPDTTKERCPTCQGNGKIQITKGFFSMSSTCSTCEGRGVFIEHPCEFCEGSGFEELEKEMQLTVPTGIEHGARLRIRREGEPGYAGGEPGDLLISIQVQESEVFEREGIDLHFRAPISFIHAALGCDLHVPTLDGPHTIRVPAGCQFGTTFRLKGKGVKHLKKKAFGDIVVHLLPVTPQTLSEEQRALLSALAKSMDLDLHAATSPLDVDVKTLWDPADKKEAAHRAPEDIRKKDDAPHTEDPLNTEGLHPSSKTINSLEQMLRQAEQALGGKK